MKSVRPARTDVLGSVGPSTLSLGSRGGNNVCSCKQGAKAALKFARSPVHAWGMFAKEGIDEGALVCEYVGEEIRKAVRTLVLFSRKMRRPAGCQHSERLCPVCFGVHGLFARCMRT